MLLFVLSSPFLVEAALFFDAREEALRLLLVADAAAKIIPLPRLHLAELLGVALAEIGKRPVLPGSQVCNLLFLFLRQPGPERFSVAHAPGCLGGGAFRREALPDDLHESGEAPAFGRVFTVVAVQRRLPLPIERRYGVLNLGFDDPRGLRALGRMIFGQVSALLLVPGLQKSAEFFDFFGRQAVRLLRRLQLRLVRR